MINIFRACKDGLCQLVDQINQLTYDEYTRPIELLGGSTIGAHTRHIVELYQQLQTGYDSAVIDYDNRKRNSEIEKNVDTAAESIAMIIANLERKNKALYVRSLYQGDGQPIESTYLREMVYNIEHCVHHQAMIKIGFLELGRSLKNVNFGVAQSTVNYRKQCAQ
jgi:uncharacterized damage-inducible protein DinB